MFYFSQPGVFVCKLEFVHSVTHYILQYFVYVIDLILGGNQLSTRMIFILSKLVAQVCCK